MRKRALYFVPTLALILGAPSALAHYSPLEGRWLQRDPLLASSQPNCYEYAMSSSIQ